MSDAPTIPDPQVTDATAAATDTTTTAYTFALEDVEHLWVQRLLDLTAELIVEEEEAPLTLRQVIAAIRRVIVQAMTEALIKDGEWRYADAYSYWRQVEPKEGRTSDE
jgi:hypothetical protein